MLCAACDEELPTGANFCPSCGAPVVVVSDEERKFVTVLFADIVGFTGLVEFLDPERVKRLVDDAFERLIADIVEFGGQVDKVLGDGVLALFGAPIAHEDDPDRAVRAALQMHDSLAGFVDEHPELGRDVELRVGVNSGEVLVGRVGGTDDYTALGDVVNVASRLQALAPPGGVYIGDSTAALVSNVIQLAVVDEFDVRGREQSEQVWNVTGYQDAPALVSPKDQVPFVGRFDQREVVGSVLSMVASGRSAILAVTGEAGVGKTRFVNEVLAGFPSESHVVLAAKCAPYGETNVWAPVAAALFGRVDPDTSSSPERLRELSLSNGVDLYGFEPDDPVLNWFVEGALYIGGHPSLLDQAPPSQARETLFRLIVGALRRRSNRGPVILWIDDLQWADPLIVELLDRITRSLFDRPILVITAQRDDIEIDWPPAHDLSMTVRMALAPLASTEAELLLAEILPKSSDTALMQRLFERSGGNPFFLIELASLARLDPYGATLPSSLRALIASRLDRLPPSSRAAIDNAAVLGATGPTAGLYEFASEMDQPLTPDDLAALDESGLIEIGSHRWRFRSDLVREVAYETLTKRVRAERHAGTAAVLAEATDVPVELVAHHAASAAELIAEIGPVPSVTAAIHDFAISQLGSAAQRSLETGAFSQALRQTNRALNLRPSDAHLHRQLVLLRAKAATERREIEPGRVDAQTALDWARSAGDEHHEGTARRLLGVQHQIEGDLEAARRELGHSVDIFRKLGDDAELATSLADRGFAEVFGGSLSDADSILAEAASLAERLENPRAGAWVLQHQAWVAFLSRDAKLAEARLDLALAAFDASGDRSGQIWARALRAYLSFFGRRFAEAEALAVAVRADALELGDRWAPAMMDSLLASLRLWSGSFVEAEELSRRALVAFRDLGDRFGVVQALAPRNRALVALGRSQEAERGLEEALAISDSFGNLSFPSMAAAGTAVHLGLGERAVVLGELALGHNIAMEADSSEISVTLALALCQVGRVDDAMAQLVDVEVDFPYAHAVRGLTAALIGDDALARSDSAAVIADEGATYLDRVIACIVAAAVEFRSGDSAAAKALLEYTAHEALVAGDAVAQALVAAATEALLGETSADHGALGVGWRNVVRLLAA